MGSIREWSIILEILSEFDGQFSSEEACREYLFKLRWPDGFCCPRCGCSKSWPTR
ncbi:MAG TPA: transposase, partial [Bryobacteraceae bacterium]|nr:transposase [Bryobacteraceae bacterium]